MSSFVLVLIAAAPDASLRDLAQSIVAERSEITWKEAVWLAPDECFEIAFEAEALEDAHAIRDAVKLRIGNHAIDVCAIPTMKRHKRLLVADMDSTIIQQECIDEMAAELGLKPQIAAITEKAMRGEIEFEAALRERLLLLSGLPESALQIVFDERITLTPGARTMISTMRANGAFTALVSSGFSFFTRRVAKAAGFDTDHANTLGIEKGLLTGRVVGPILGREAKREALDVYVDELGLVAAHTLAVGDGANDLDMLRAAGLGVAFRAHPKVAAAAGASIVHCDLSAVLYLQGYKKDEFIFD